MLLITVTYGEQKHCFEHGQGPIEFGRASHQGGVKRGVINDPSISRNKVRVKERPDGRVRIENLSSTNAVPLPDGTRIASGLRCDLHPPVNLAIRSVLIKIAKKPPEEPAPIASLRTVNPPV